MTDTLRNSIVGLFINTISDGRFLPFPEQRLGWQLPANLQLARAASSPPDSKVHETSESVSFQPTLARNDLEETISNRTSANAFHSSINSYRKSLSSIEKAQVDLNMKPVHETVSETIVNWYDEHDQENPQNWSLGKRIFVLGLVSLLTFGVYIGSAIYPLSEIPSIGRTPVYMATLLIFVLLQLPIIYAPNIQTLLAMRFFTGFFGSPALATGGASIQDMFPIIKLPYALIVWSVTASCGPILGPIIGGFAAQNRNWTWPLWELFYIGVFAFIVLLFWLPETNAETILLKRAQRLRKLTGNPNLFSKSEIKQSKLKPSEVLFESLLRPFQLMIEPAVLYANVYLGLTYAIFYLWFEAFPLVYGDIYHFNLGLSGLPFTGLLVTCILASSVYVCWNYYHVEPIFRKTGYIVPESRLAVALVASGFVPASLLIFGKLILSCPTQIPDLPFSNRMVFPAGCALDCPNYRRSFVYPRVGLFAN
ncbi:Caffeine resistance protein 5 [Psilocybe cubensis]|uniref:Caffeine resistance protein 5 n=1 Tax=Psilocybe cubensis TaxID=181762 RepID=A0ACB8GNG2_PSICU|nr:Caffeine resistance protein 5 [Psilocybe cubensis]KAH9476584.1 Caffeine resistance protein 5 [Psilocybe cubensis]